MEPQVIDAEFTTSANFITKYTEQFLKTVGVPEDYISVVNLLIVLALAALVVYLLQKVVNWGVTFIFKRLHKITKLNIFKYAIKNRLPHYLALVVPYTFVINAIPTIFVDYKQLIGPCIKIADIYIVFMIIWTIMALVHSLANMLEEKTAFRHKPMKSYLQVIQIVFYIFGAVAIYSILTGHSATGFFAAMGAASAVVLLMFQDTIKGFVASIQISSNNTVQVGDWITMNKYGADGDVEEINLSSVKVRNFDKTITTIPTYALISDSFQNWRGMQESGGRRIKRSITIKQSDIRHLSDEELDEFEKFTPLAEFIKKKRAKYDALNKKLHIDSGSILKGFGITNCDLFMTYITWYLKHNPDIRNDMTLLVRQMPPAADGLPIEIYTFTNTTVWGDYEAIMAEIFNHLITAVRPFNLTILETVSSTDSLTVNLKQ
ncbi:miniconductance mechanosensitive channel [Dysgonomonas sp. PH5-45]|uniref:mechanosensitive ion channel family protein n=1 Tax=unclassified Dysgonomonas TaxID=2630389 RepID=UPI00247422EE|nr:MULTISPECIES: mechanosensitive ion channel domain-containing protein [unclassified Dysgonomonas]MDH6355979.1 miniconductance mechanosensitive channel [Dysgonomonas sp. PH5-45]MDH6388876.1 miniconductance mechanosensitive channel [Dysgonomonas sp. PH5-37]